MSLYGGIKFSLAEDSASAGIARTGKDDPSKDQGGSAASSSSKPPAAAPTLAAAGFSSSLKFAPRLNRPKPAARPPGTTFNAGVLEKQATVHRPTETAAISSPGEAKRGDATAGEAQGKDQVQIGPDGKPLASAPSMTIAQDKRPKRDREEERKRQKRKKKRKQQQQLLANFNPDEPYDPSRPNDLVEYQQYRKRLRAERRAKYMEEKRRREAGESSGSSYYTDSEDEAPRRDAPRLFAPPKMYSPPTAAASLVPAQPPSPPRDLAPPPPPPTVSSAAATGDDAYARRQAMSGIQTGDDAYARRLAMSQPMMQESARPAAATPSMAPEVNEPPRPPASAMPPFPPAPPPSLPPFAPTGPPAMPTFAPTMPPATAAPLMPPFPPSHGTAGPQVMPPFAPAHTSHTLPPFPPSAPPAMPPFAPAASPVASARPPLSTAPVEPTTAVDPNFNAALEERKRAAAAIAAKFSNLKPAPPKMEDLTGTFAEKMMKKWGHVEGTGIGARGDGLVHALTTEHVAKPTDPNKPLSKRQLAKQRVAAANAKKRKWVQAPSARGRIVDANAEAKAAEEREKMGDASRIICLIGMVESEDDVDEEMPEEIGEECSKYGIVERVVLHMVEPPPPEPSECLRVFVVFSGMAGAWRAIKEMDGRFFGGRKIKAAYFPEARFDAGDRDGSLL